MDLWEQVMNIRKEFEGAKIPNSTLIELYAKYSDVHDPVRFVTRAKDLFPKGNCGLASLYIKKVLGMGKITQGTYENESHTFLVFGKQVIDITADQYGGPKVYVGPLIAPWSK